MPPISVVTAPPTHRAPRTPTAARFSAPSEWA
jgi:hypothetical protein